MPTSYVTKSIYILMNIENDLIRTRNLVETLLIIDYISLYS